MTGLGLEFKEDDFSVVNKYLLNHYLRSSALGRGIFIVHIFYSDI